MSFSTYMHAGLFVCTVTLTSWTPPALSIATSTHNIGIQQLATIVKRTPQASPDLQAALLESMWETGEINTTDYLFQVQQTLDTQIAGIKLHRNLWGARIEWLSASNTLNKWLNQTTSE